MDESRMIPVPEDLLTRLQGYAETHYQTCKLFPRSFVDPAVIEADCWALNGLMAAPSSVGDETPETLEVTAPVDSHPLGGLDSWEF